MMKHKLKYLLVGLISGCVLMFAATALAEPLKTYLLVRAEYSVYVEGEEYDQEELPFLNYEGFTYVPLRALGELIGADVQWNKEKREVHIQPAGADDIDSHPAFRHIEVRGSGGQYIVTGVARVFEGNMRYAVSDGHNYLVDDFVTLEMGAPHWSTFELKLDIPEESLPYNGTLTLELFEESAKDGSIVNLRIIPLEQFVPEPTQ
jgi:hypothetical protein